MYLNNVVPIKPQRPIVSEACRWHEALESVASSNLKIIGAWQRMFWRAFWGM